VSPVAGARPAAGSFAGSQMYLRFGGGGGVGGVGPGMTPCLSRNERRPVVPRSRAQGVFIETRRGEIVVQVTDSMREYWSKNLRITAVLLVIWFVVTYVASFYARELNEIVVFGFPLGFYMGAQGSLIIYVIIIAFYAGYMNRLDRKYGVHEEE
jgi:putative solute:sodium symporter small subunit